MKKFFEIIRQSLNGNTNDPSTVRIQSYLVLAPILLCVIVFLIIEIWSFIHAIRHGSAYQLSNEIVVVFGMILSHHLAVLFQRNKSQSILDIKGTPNNEQAPVIDAPVTPAVETTTNTTTDTTTDTTTHQINS